MTDQTLRPSASAGFAALFTPKLITVLREGYGLAQLRRDAIAGLTVAIVALPLSMAIAIASGVTPRRGFIPPSSAGFWSRFWAVRGSRSAVRPGPLSCWLPQRSLPMASTG